MTSGVDAISNDSVTMPTFFIPHGGGPCFFMDWTLMGGPADTWDKTEAWLRSLLSTLPQRPKAILVVSAHWEADEFTVSSVENPAMIFDYYGFPPHTYELSYPASGAPELANRVSSLLQQASIEVHIDSERGFDHGVFVPFLLIDPDAAIPVVPVSLKSGLNPEEHIALGEALAPLRKEGVLIIGSGMSFHNMRAFRTPAAIEPSAQFDTWLTETVEAESAVRNAGLIAWEHAPAGRFSHPREEHLLPLMVAAGAGGDSKGCKVFGDNVMSSDISAYRFG